ncbi:MAG: diguanylate cyclase, partial [Succinivibrionaceae bacterium]|nr:diguanylate cyclase [Succinivibrionaceae bacterium]
MTELTFRVFLPHTPVQELDHLASHPYSYSSLILEFEDLDPSGELPEDAMNCCSIVITDSKEAFDRLFSREENAPQLLIAARPEDAVGMGIGLEEGNFAGLIPLGRPAAEQVLAFQQAVKGAIANFRSVKYKGFLDTMIDGMPELVWFKTCEGAHMMVNQKFCSTVRKTREDIRGHGHYYIWDITPAEYMKGEFVCMESEQEVMDKMHTCVFEEQVLTHDGMKHFMTYKTPLLLPDGQLWGTVGIAYNLSDYSNLGVEMSYVFETLPHPIMIRDANGVASFISTKFKNAFGVENLNDFDYERWMKAAFDINVHDQGKQRTETTSKTEKINSLVYKLHDSDRYFRIIESEIHDYFGNRTGFYNVFEDVTTEEVYRLKVQDLADHDPLTNLYNRRYFIGALERNNDREQAIIFLDLDFFKLINDNYS